MKKKNSKRSVNFKRLAITAIIFLLALYFIWTFISQQIMISKKNKEISELQMQIESIEAESQRLSKEVEDLNNPEYIEKIARERLGLVRPNERVFVDSNKSEENKGK